MRFPPEWNPVFWKEYTIIEKLENFKKFQKPCEADREGSWPANKVEIKVSDLVIILVDFLTPWRQNFCEIEIILEFFEFFYSMLPNFQEPKEYFWNL